MSVETKQQDLSSPPKDRWDKFHIVSSGLLVPLSIAAVGFYYGATQKDAENRVKYVEIAVQQLRAEPTPETAALRTWAVDLLEAHSPVKLPAEARDQLLKHPLAKVVELSGHGAAVSSGSATLSVSRASGALN